MGRGPSTCNENQAYVPGHGAKRFLVRVPGSLKDLTFHTFDRRPQPGELVRIKGGLYEGHVGRVEKRRSKYKGYTYEATPVDLLSVLDEQRRTQDRTEATLRRTRTRVLELDDNLEQLRRDATGECGHDACGCHDDPEQDGPDPYERIVMAYRALDGVSEKLTKPQILTQVDAARRLIERGLVPKIDEEIDFEQVKEMLLR